MKFEEKTLVTLAKVRQARAQKGSPCARCRKTACPDPCYPHLDWYRHRGKAPADLKPRTREAPAGKPRGG